MKKAEKVYKTFEKYSNYFEGSFYNTLWQIIVNEYFKNRRVAFYFTYNDYGALLVIADVNGGYYLTSTYFKSLPYEGYHSLILKLNKDVFNHESINTENIITKSMFG